MSFWMNISRNPRGIFRETRNYLKTCWRNTHRNPRLNFLKNIEELVRKFIERSFITIVGKFSENILGVLENLNLKLALEKNSAEKRMDEHF